MNSLKICGDPDSGCENSDTFDAQSIICTQCVNMDKHFNEGEKVQTRGFGEALVKSAVGRDVVLETELRICDKTRELLNFLDIGAYRFLLISVEGEGKELVLKVVHPKKFSEGGVG